MALVGAAIFVKSLANSYFFKDATDSGLVGGIFVATLISCVNVLVASFVLGRHILPQFNHVQAFRKVLFGGIGLLASVTVIVLINLAAAHTRAIISRAAMEGSLASTQAFTDAIVAVKDKGFSIENFEAWMLFVVGLIIAFAAAIKGYSSDDVYPNYGHEDRIRRKAEQAYSEERAQCREAVISTIRTVEADMSAYIKRVRRDCQEYETSIVESKRFLSSYSMWLAHLNETANTLIRLYRDKNRRIRTSTAPAYFAEDISVFDQKNVKLSSIEKDEELAKKSNDQLQGRLEALWQENKEKLLALQNEYLSEVNDFYKTIEHEVEAQLSADIPIGKLHAVK